MANVDGLSLAWGVQGRMAWDCTLGLRVGVVCTLYLPRNVQEWVMLLPGRRERGWWPMTHNDSQTGLLMVKEAWKPKHVAVNQWKIVFGQLKGTQRLAKQTAWMDDCLIMIYEYDINTLYRTISRYFELFRYTQVPFSTELSRYSLWLHQHEAKAIPAWIVLPVKTGPIAKRWSQWSRENSSRDLC